MAQETAQQQAEADQRLGLSAPNLTNWSPGARDAYQSQRDWIKKQEDAKKST